MTDRQLLVKATEWFRSTETASEYPKIIYAAFGDVKGAGKLTYTSDYERCFPAYRQNILLDLLYDWLISLGYEISADERALRDGTHEIFSEGNRQETKEDAHGNCAEAK